MQCHPHRDRLYQFISQINRTKVCNSFDEFIKNVFTKMYLSSNPVTFFYILEYYPYDTTLMQGTTLMSHHQQPLPPPHHHVHNLPPSNMMASIPSAHVIAPLHQIHPQQVIKGELSWRHLIDE